MADFVQRYNEERLHSTVGYIAPMDKLLGREKEIFQERRSKTGSCARTATSSAGACYNRGACSEDRALLASNPNATTGPEAKVEGRQVALGVSDLLRCFFPGTEAGAFF